MDESNSSEELSPFRVRPMDEVLESLGLGTSKWSSNKKQKEGGSPLEPINLQEVLESTQAVLKQNAMIRANKKSLAPTNEQRPITFKVPKRVSMSRNIQKGHGNSSNSVKRQTKRFTSTSQCKIDNKLAKSYAHVRKELFSTAETSAVSLPKPRKANNNKNSLLPGISRINNGGENKNSTPKKIQVKEQVKPSGNLNKPRSIPKRKEVQFKTSTGSDDDFELLEAACKRQSPASVGFMENFNYLQELHKQQHAIGLEIDRVMKIMLSNVDAKTNSKGTKVSSIKLSSAKKVNLLKSILLKTVQEEIDPNEAARMSEQRKVPIDAKMTQSISMYNSMRGHILRTPKMSRKSLEKGDSISTTVQKQCLLLMDTPKADTK